MCVYVCESMCVTCVLMCESMCATCESMCLACKSMCAACMHVEKHACCAHVHSCKRACVWMHVFMPVAMENFKAFQVIGLPHLLKSEHVGFCPFQVARRGCGNVKKLEPSPEAGDSAVLRLQDAALWNRDHRDIPTTQTFSCFCFSKSYIAD